MTEAQKLEFKIKCLDQGIKTLERALKQYNEERHELWMNLNRARRLEREELQNDK